MRPRAIDGKRKLQISMSDKKHIRRYLQGRAKKRISRRGFQEADARWGQARYDGIPSLG